MRIYVKRCYGAWSDGPVTCEASLAANPAGARLKIEGENAKGQSFSLHLEHDEVVAVVNEIAKIRALGDKLAGINV